MACGILDGRNCKRNIKRRAVLAYADSFEMIDALTSPDPLKDHGFLVPAIGRNYKHNALADGLFSRIAEQALGTFIPTGDHAIQILADNRIVRGTYDSRQQIGGSFGLFSFIDVMKEIHHTDNRARVVANGVNVHGNYNAASVRLFDDDFLLVDRGPRL